MRKIIPLGVVLAAASGCGLENLFSNVGREARERPATTVVGSLGDTPTVRSLAPAQIVMLDGEGNPLEVGQGLESDVDQGIFRRSTDGASYELRLVSGTYNMLRLQSSTGSLVLRAIVSGLAPESKSTWNLDAEAMAAALVTEARYSALGTKFSLVTPVAWDGARAKMDADFEAAGTEANVLLGMVRRIMAQADPLGGATLAFTVPKYDASFEAVDSALNASLLALNPFDYTGDGTPDDSTGAFDAALAAAAQAYRPEGCPSATKIQLVFTVDFNEGALDGNCSNPPQFRWATDKPGKRMFFVGFVHEDSEDQRGEINTLLGAGTPNQITMYDDGTNGDEAAGDNIWTKAFALELQPGKKLRVGYKYTWGTFGASWSGSEEWPGNSRILQVEDVNGDGFVYRRDTWADESTNKDRANANFRGSEVSWDTAFHDSPCLPEAREQPFTPGTMCTCSGTWFEPQALGPIVDACP